MHSAPQSRSGRYEELDSGQLVDAVERAYERDELLDWELVFELSRRAVAGESRETNPGSVEAALPA